MVILPKPLQGTKLRKGQIDSKTEKKAFHVLHFSLLIFFIIVFLYKMIAMHLKKKTSYTKHFKKFKNISAVLMEKHRAV